MKKLLFFLLLLPAMLLAAPVDPNVAQQVAENFINAPETDASGIVRKAPHKRKCMARAPKQITNDQQFYIFNSEDGEGFVIVSADDVAHPILGYSLSSAWDNDNIPGGLHWLLEEHNRQIQWAKENNIEQGKDIALEWRQIRLNQVKSATTVVGPLIQTEWGQSPYYNAKCPYNSLVGQRTVTGCVATAMAQVMRYHNWPQMGAGFHSYTCAWYGTQSASFGSTTYDWANMPIKLDENSSQQQINAVSTLMYHCGVATDMDYGVSGNFIVYNGHGSGTDVTLAADAAKQYFRYDNATTAVFKQNYSDQDWIALLKSQLDNNMPMVYRGRDTNAGGHAFICDGYRSDNTFHINWGWDGAHKEEYYALSALTASGYDFSTDQIAIINMKPRTNYNEANIQLSSPWVLSSDSITYGGTLAASVSIKNYGTTSFTGDISAIVLDKDGNFFTELSLKKNYTLAKNATLTLNPSVSGNAGLVPGRYYVALFFKNDDFGYQIVGSEYYVNLTTFKVYHQAEIETFSDFGIYSNDNNQLVTGHQSQICLTLKNTGSTNFRGTVALALYTSDLSTGQDYDEISLSLVGIAAGATRTLTFSGTISLDPGTYVLALVYRDNNDNFNFAGSTYYSNPVYVVVKGEGEEDMPTDSITVKAKMPSDWGSSISAWAWLDGSEGQWVTLERDGEWYSYTTSAIPLNIVFVNGTTWNGDNNQTVDIRLAQSSCLQIGSNTTGKRTYTVVDCPSEDFQLTPGKYVIVANRNKDGDRNWYYMTSDLGTASTKRFQAITTGTENINDIAITNLENKYVWTLEADGTNWKLKNGTQYVTWTSGNSANLGATAKSLTFEVADNQVQAHFNDGTAERYLSLNATTNNNYFAFYANTNQITNLFFLPYDDGSTPPPPARDCKSVPYTETFASSQGDFSVDNLTLPDGFTSIWNWDSQYGMVAKCIKGSTKYESESWLISPCVELPENETCVLSFSHAAKFFQSTSQMSLWISTDYDESDPEAAQWNRLIIPTYPTGSNWNWYESGDIDLSEYKGQYVNIAFRYTSTSSYAPQWEIKNFAIRKQSTTGIDGIYSNKPSAIKILRNGQIYIIRGDKTYTLQGQEVK